MEALRLYHIFQNNGRGPLPPSEKQHFVYDSGLVASEISVGMLERIFERLESTETHFWHHKCLTWDMRWLESHSYPNERKKQWKLTELEDQYRFQSHWEEHMKKPNGNSKELIEPLGLPELPSSVFCYYVQDKWAWRLINRYRAGRGRVMTPSMKAEVLKQTRVF
jgi:hypothetical protein